MIITRYALFSPSTKMPSEEEAVVVDMDNIEKNNHPTRRYKRNDSLEIEARTPSHSRDPKVSECNHF